jgi:hypothetical protein
MKTRNSFVSNSSSSSFILAVKKQKCSKCKFDVSKIIDALLTSSDAESFEELDSLDKWLDRRGYDARDEEESKYIQDVREAVKKVDKKKWDIRFIEWSCEGDSSLYNVVMSFEELGFITFVYGEMGY